MRRNQEWVFAALAVILVGAVVAWVDLSPRVESDFFFSANDPQLRATVEITERFPSPDQLVIRVAGPDIGSPAYRAGIDTVSRRLRGAPGVEAVYSIARDDPESPLWGRLLLPPGGAATNIIAQVGDLDPARLVPGIEQAVAGRTDIEISGVPYVVELIRRSLRHDFVIFSLAALLVFAVVVQVVYRSGRLVAGTLSACLTACALTVSITDLAGMRIGLLTANIVTIVFVLTLSHIVFITSNWRRLSADPSAGADLVAHAKRETFPASIWCAVTTLSGFLSLLLASARPLRDLGLAGAIGTVVALATAYAVYPAFLHAGSVDTRSDAREHAGWLPVRHGTRWLAGIAVVVVALIPGVLRLSTDPSLLSYFGRHSTIRRGLDAVDADGGSSPLYMVVRDSGGRRVDTDAVHRAMWTFQDALEADRSVGVVLSPVIILAHARQQPLAGFFGWRQLLDILDQPLFHRIAASFVTADRQEGLFFLRMREAGRETSRAAVVARLRAMALRAGLEVTAVGGAYELQAQLGRLIGKSLRFGLGGLVLLFIGVAFVVSRSVSWTLPMVACLTAIPIVVLGTIGWAGVPVDIITSPAANVALAMGVDSMIHLVMRARRVRDHGSVWDAVAQARADLWRPILGATLIICAGFGLFSLSAFPPTQRFGVAVILGTLTAAVMTLVALPFALRWAAGRVRE
ncbi:MAG TPA: MMPL family transporter [Gemmatimonadales bacterium]